MTNRLSKALAPLEATARWINWELRDDASRSEKPAKLPISPRTGLVCDITDPNNHCSYEKARATGKNIGFVFDDEDKFWFLDIDNCLEPGGVWSPLARGLVQKFGRQAACEVSQSGKGLHIFGRANHIPLHACRNTELGLELYHTGRFVALTDHMTTGQIGYDTSTLLAAVVDEFFPPTKQDRTPTEWTDGPQDGGGITDDDEELLRIMLRSGLRTASAFFDDDHVAFADLWNADGAKLGARYQTNDHRAYDSSRADYGLASHLAYWTAKDCERIDRFMRSSALAREKWQRSDYLSRTILRAVSTVRGVATRPTSQDLAPEADSALKAMPGFDSSEGPSEQSIADAFREQFAGTLRFDHGMSRWLEWTGTHWHPDHIKRAYHHAAVACRQFGV